VRSVVVKVALGLVFLLVCGFSFFSIIPQLLSTHLQKHVALPRRTNGRRSALSGIGECCIRKYIHSLRRVTERRWYQNGAVGGLMDPLRSLFSDPSPPIPTTKLSQYAHTDDAMLLMTASARVFCCRVALERSSPSEKFSCDMT
jgi:hypothetical protein